MVKRIAIISGSILLVCMTIISIVMIQQGEWVTTSSVVEAMKTQEDYLSELEDLIEQYAEGNISYKVCETFLAGEKDWEVTVDKDSLNTYVEQLERIQQSKEIYKLGIAYYQDEKYLNAVETLLEVIPEDIENYQEARDLITTLRENVVNSTLAQAEKLMKGYYREEALNLLMNIPEVLNNKEIIEEKLKEFNNHIDNLVAYEGEISHIFFHSLIVDTTKAFDGDGMEAGYNDWMTTVDEFNKMLEHMYERGYVLIDVHNLYEEVVNEKGEKRFKTATLFLPEGKKPLVLSIDDVNYYQYMKKDGFADRLVLDEEGNVKNAYITDDGEILIGDYDVVPLLDKFVEKHPDFSYQGAKGILAITGYEGILGYRTDLFDSPTYEEDLAQVTAVVERLKETGWLFASHSYGHRNAPNVSYRLWERDTKQWRDEVESIVGPTNIYIYPYGAEVHPGDPKFELLREYGFEIFAGVWNKPYYKVFDDYMRMTRRNLDGITLRKNPKVLEDLMDPYEVIDPARPNN